jgi:hypothetical protein
LTNRASDTAAVLETDDSRVVFAELGHHGAVSDWKVRKEIMAVNAAAIMTDDSRAQPLQQVDRRAKLSVREFNKEYRALGRPVVITDAIEDWTARHAWSFEYFRTRYTDETVTAFRFKDGRYRPDLVATLPMGALIDEVTSKDWKAFPHYVRDDWRFLQAHSELLADYKVPKYFFDWFVLLPKFMRLVYPRIFIGPKGAVTPLHLDIWGTHAWLSQLVGRKRWLLFSPDQHDLLYDCGVDPIEPDFERFPRYRKARPLECIIGPGDTIFVPSGWAHHVESLDATISLTVNYMGPGCLRSCLTSAVREMLLDRVKAKLSKALTRSAPASNG